MPTVQARNPLRNYQFRIAVVNSFTVPPTAPTGYVAGVKTVSGLRVQINPWEQWEGGNNLHRYANPNKVIWEPVTLESGVALDDTFELWAQAVLDFSTSCTRNAAQPVKRQVVIDLWDENMYPAGPPTIGTATSFAPSGQLPDRDPIGSNPTVGFTVEGPRCRRYRLINAWISKYAPLPKLDSMTSEVALMSIELVHEGWVKEEIK